MLHKHPSAEKAQIYFGITEKLKHEAANFFIYIQPKLAQIYDNSVCSALGEDFNSKTVRDRHLNHLSTLLTGGIDHRFIEESHFLHKNYRDQGITTGEYVKLYQLIISYLSGEAHKKHWIRYKKYRDLNRSIRNLLLFDLAVATSPKELELSLNNPRASKMVSVKNPEVLRTAQEELKELIENSHAIVRECHLAIQSILTSTSLDKPPHSEDSKSPSINTEVSLFSNDIEEHLEKPKALSNQKHPALEEILSLTQEKIQKVPKAFSKKNKTMNSQEVKALEETLNDLHYDLSTIANIHTEAPSPMGSSQRTLRSLLKKSSATIGSHLNRLEQLKTPCP